jgi:hypothetical protein
VIDPLPATQRGAVLAGLNAKPCGWPAASVDPRCGRRPLNPPPEPGSKNGPRTKIRQSEVSTLSGDGHVDFTVSKLYGMLPADTSGDPTQRTAAQNQTVRTVFVVGPDKRIKLSLAYPMTTGRKFDEVLRAIDSLQLTATHRVATPANWRYGDDVIIAGSVSDDQARTIWPQGWYAPRPYIRIVSQP